MNKLLKQLLEKANRAIFGYAVKAGLVMCVVPPSPGGQAIDIEVGQGAEGEGGSTDDQDAADTEQQGADQGQADESDVVVTIGDEPAPAEEEETARAPEWVRELRKNHRELQRKNRELEEKLSATSGNAEPKHVQLSKKPTLEDFDYDAEKFEQALEGWYDQKRQADEQAARVKSEQEAQQKAWQARLDHYGKAKSDLKVKDFDDAEAVAQETLSVTQQGILLQGSDNPALLVYALGKNPKKAKELAAMNDPVKFAFAVAKLETQLKVTQRKAAPPPEKTVRGTAPVSGSVDSNLDRLRAEAEKTGDYSKVVAYKQQQRRKAA